MNDLNPVSPRTRSAKRAVVLAFSAIGFALLLAALGVILMGAGQFYAVVLILLALALGWWGKHELQRKEPEIK